MTRSGGRLRFWYCRLAIDSASCRDLGPSTDYPETFRDQSLLNLMAEREGRDALWVRTFLGTGAAVGVVATLGEIPSAASAFAQGIRSGTPVLQTYLAIHAQLFTALTALPILNEAPHTSSMQNALRNLDSDDYEERARI